MTKTFRDLGVHPALCDALEAGGITHPFPIQELTLPLALEGHDLIGQARTGTGKTLAFGLPLLQRLAPDRGQTQALVIVPTRELCLQVYEDLKIGAGLGISSISVYGGVGYDEQIEALTSGVHVVVGTPGRLLDHLNRGNLDLSNVTQLVLDEADEMLDMGFLPDVERLVEACKGADRHTMLFSATMPTPIVKLARRYMDHPTFTRADHEVKTTADNVTQYFFQVHRMDKPRLLARILQEEDRGGVYVFVRTKHMADRLVNDLEELHTPAVAIHGDLRQSQREKNLDRFRSGKATVLVATEVAARGLDVSGVTHVVNYDCPEDEKMYLHRIGRTARAGESGKAITFAEFNEVDRLNVIRKKVEATDSELLQVFSTSPVLEELFRLPATRPWDHLVAEGREREDQRRSGSASRRSSPRDGGAKRGANAAAGATAAAATPDVADEPGTAEGTDAARDARTDRERRRGSSDGRPKGGRDREGRGRDRDADRARRDRDRAGRDRADQPDQAGHAEQARDAGGSQTSADAPATRTRTRTRTRTSTAPATRNDRDAAEPAAEAASGEGTSGSDPSASDGGRHRTRARGRGRTPSARSTASPAGTQETAPHAGEEGGAAASTGSRADRDTGQRRDSRTRGAKGRGAKGRGGQGRGGQGRDNGRTSASRSRGNAAAGSEASSQATTDAAAGATATSRGEQARGEGQPQRARRVRVEHLP
ncbi:MAG: DEAD/DEAH box helicase [Nitriliruptoraceae bacterium]